MALHVKLTLVFLKLKLETSRKWRDVTHASDGQLSLTTCPPSCHRKDIINIHTLRVSSTHVTVSTTYECVNPLCQRFTCSYVAEVVLCIGIMLNLKPRELVL